MVKAARLFAVKSPLTVIGGVVGLFFCLILGIVVLAVSGEDLSATAKTLIITTLMTNVFAAIPTILNLYKTEAVSHDLHNGVVKDKMKEAIVEVASDTDSDGVYINTHGMRTREETDNG